LPSLIGLYKKAYAGLSRETWFLSLVILINRSGTMVLPYMSMYATKVMGFSVAQAGILLAMFGAGSILGAFVGGRITDKLGFQSVQLFALFGGGVMFIALGFLTTFYSLSIGCFVLSTINESFRPANSAAIAAYSSAAARTRSYSLNRLAINLGWAFGGAIGGFLAAHDYSLIFWVDGITNICAAFLLMLVLPRKKAITEAVTPSAELERSGASSAYKDKRYLAFIFLTVMFAFTFFQMFTILPVFLRSELHITEEKYGVLMAFNGLLIAVMEMVLVYQLEKTRKPMQFIGYGVWLIGLSYALYNIFPGTYVLAFISVITITFGEMLSMPFMNTFWISRSAAHNRGQYAALYTMAWGTAQVAGPSFGGYIADQYSFYHLWWIIFAIAIAAGIGFRFITK
jgi:predicted MFS family arabinose efflux permease